MSRPTRYVAELDHVREVTVRGTADLPFWEERLGPEGLVPLEKGGRARVLMIAASAAFKGLPFRELSVCVEVARPGGAGGDEACFLVGAFNSSRLFAFCERVFFSTPYRHGDVRVATSPPSVRLIERGGTTFLAEAGDAPAQESGQAGWEGPVYLPGGRRRFFAKIRGGARTAPFPDPAGVTLRPAGPGVVRALADSHFTAEEWVVRDDAFHAKSKTVNRAGPE